MFIIAKAVFYTIVKQLVQFQCVSVKECVEMLHPHVDAAKDECSSCIVAET